MPPTFVKLTAEQIESRMSRFKALGVSQDLAKRLAESNTTGPMDRVCSADLRDADFTAAKFDGLDFLDCDLRGAKLDGAMGRVELSRCNLGGASLRSVDLGGVIAQCDATGADLRGANLVGRSIQDTILRDADLRGIIVDDRTEFLRLKDVTGCRIDRHVLESLKGYGGLTAGQRMTMQVEDAVATLRASYSGFLQWVHMAALTLFLMPYLLFLVRHWMAASPTCPDGKSCVTLLGALWQFIYTGGRFDATVALAPFVIFWFSLAYNALRAVLLWKTKALELDEESRRLPPLFSLSGWWGRAYTLAQVGFVLNLALVCWHTIHFLSLKIPAPQ